MIEICESFATLHFMEFNPIKSKLLCFNCDTLNWVISDFRACDSITLDDLHRTVCLHLYGVEL